MKPSIRTVKTVPNGARECKHIAIDNKFTVGRIKTAGVLADIWAFATIATALILKKRVLTV